MVDITENRRYDIDWIRVIAFDILIIYHVGMFFCPWDWHIKNNVIVEWLTYPMLFTSYWRLPILFVVSGMGTRFAFSNKSGPSYIQERIKRLSFPLVIGILLIVPPQVYIERISQGLAYANYFDFYPHFFEGIYPHGNFSWHHLWFLPYLLSMSVVSTPLFLYLKNEQNSIIKKIQGFVDKFPSGLYLFILPLIVIELFMVDKFPVTRALVGDWYALAFYFYFFILGYVLICIKSSFWSAILKMRYIALSIGLVVFLLLSILEINYYTYGILKIINIWSVILAIFGFSARYLNKESKIIKYRTKAVYPFYILHQTITVICGYFLMDSAMHYSLKILLMTVITFGVSWLLYEQIIQRIPFLQPIFGVRNNSKHGKV